MTHTANRLPRARLPAALSLGILGAVMCATAALALHRERAVGSGSPAAGEEAQANMTQSTVRDVLTGRPVMEDGQPVTPTSGWGSPEQPIRIRFVPSNDQPEIAAGIDELLGFLRKRTGYAMDGAILRSYGLVVQELVQGQAEVAFLTAASYARARFATENNDSADDDVEAFLSAVRPGNPAFPGSDLAYRGAILVRKDSGITDIKQLHAGRSIAMGSRTSGASSILPTAMLNQLGLAPRIQRFEGYPVIVTAVLQGSVDAGAIWWSPATPERPENDARMTVASTNPDVFETTRILAYTPWIPNEPVVIRKAVPARVRQDLARAIALYAATKATTPEGRNELMAIGGVIGFLPATNADYESLMDIIVNAFANDPEGRADFMAGK